MKAYFEILRLCVVLAVANQMAGVKGRVESIEGDSRAGESCVRAQALQRLTGQPSLAESQIGNPAHGFRDADYLECAGLLGFSVAELVACGLGHGQSRDQGAGIHAIQRRIDRDVVFALTWNQERELSTAAIWLNQPAVSDMHLGRG